MKSLSIKCLILTLDIPCAVIYLWYTTVFLEVWYKKLLLSCNKKSPNLGLCSSFYNGLSIKNVNTFASFSSTGINKCGFDP
jgi:hypothetical protein